MNSSIISIWAREPRRKQSKPIKHDNIDLIVIINRSRSSGGCLPKKSNVLWPVTVKTHQASLWLQSQLTEIWQVPCSWQWTCQTAPFALVHGVCLTQHESQTGPAWPGVVRNTRSLSQCHGCLARLLTRGDAARHHQVMTQPVHSSVLYLWLRTSRLTWTGETGSFAKCVWIFARRREGFAPGSIYWSAARAEQIRRGLIHKIQTHSGESPCTTVL